MKNKIKEVIVGSFLIVITVFLLNPFNFWMPDFLVMCMLASLLALFALFAIFILREKATDERENIHRALAGRNAFLAGSFLLTLAIVLQSYSHNLDYWLVLVLIVMILTKIITRFWTDNNL